MPTPFTNQAQLTYNGAVTNSNIAQGTIEEVLTISKTALSNEYSTDERVTYIISLANTGATDATNVTVTDNLGAYQFNDTTTLYPLNFDDNAVAFYVNGVLSTTPTVTPGPPLVFSGITVPANGNAQIVYEADVNEFAPLATANSVNNVATATGDGLTTVSDNAIVAATDEPLLSITKSISPVPVAENGRLTYTFLIQNNGNTAVTADGDAIITDTFDPVLSNIAVTFNGTTLTQGTDYDYDENTGVFSTRQGVVSVPAAAFTQDETTGAVAISPGTSTLVISGNI